MGTLSRIWQVALVLFPLIREVWRATHPNAGSALGFPGWRVDRRSASELFDPKSDISHQYASRSVRYNPSPEKTCHLSLSGQAITRPPTPEDIKIELKAVSNKAVHNAKCWGSYDGPIGDRNQTRLPERYAENALTNDIGATLSERYGKDTSRPQGVDKENDDPTA